jgi:hypothetical protein
MGEEKQTDVVHNTFAGFPTTRRAWSFHNTSTPEHPPNIVSVDKYQV